MDLGCRTFTEQKGPAHKITLTELPLSFVEEKAMGESYCTLTHCTDAAQEWSFLSTVIALNQFNENRQASCFHTRFLFIISFFLGFRGKKKPSIFPWSCVSTAAGVKFALPLLCAPFPVWSAMEEKVGKTRSKLSLRFFVIFILFLASSGKLG